MMLAASIAKEPLGPVARKGAQRFFDIGRWALCWQIAAEEVAVTGANVDQTLTSQVPHIQRLLGVTGGIAPMIGLDNR